MTDDIVKMDKFYNMTLVIKLDLIILLFWMREEVYLKETLTSY